MLPRNANAVRMLSSSDDAASVPAGLLLAGVVESWLKLVGMVTAVPHGIGKGDFMELHDIARSVGTAVVVCFIGPALWLFAEYGSNVCESLIRKAVRRWGSKKPGAQDRLLKNLARLRVIRK